MPREIDFEDLIKIVTDIEQKNKKIKKPSGLNEYNKTNEKLNTKDLEYAVKINNLDLIAIEIDKLMNRVNVININDRIEAFEIIFKIIENVEDCELEYMAYPETSGHLLPVKEFPDFHLFSPLNIKRYIAWRTKVKNGKFTYYNAKFFYILVNEIYHHIGVKSVEEGFDLLAYMTTELMKLAFRNHDISRKIIFEYIYLNPNINFEKCFSYEIIIKLSYPIFTTEIESLSNLLYQKKYYDLAKTIMSRYYLTDIGNAEKKVADTFAYAIEKTDKFLEQYGYNIIELLTEYQKEDTSLLLTKILLNKEGNKTRIKISNSKYEFNDIQLNVTNNKIICKVRIISEFCLAFLLVFIYERVLKNLKFIKKARRKIYIRNMELANLLSSNEYENYLKKAIEKRNFKEEHKVEIDLLKLEEIRIISQEVSSKLITEEDLKEETEEIKEEKIINLDDPYDSIIVNLTDVEKTILKMFLNNENISIIKRECNNYNILLEVMIEKFNEIALSFIDDIIIDDDYNIYDEYKKELIERLL